MRLFVFEVGVCANSEYRKARRHPFHRRAGPSIPLIPSKCHIGSKDKSADTLHFVPFSEQYYHGAGKVTIRFKYKYKRNDF